MKKQEYKYTKYNDDMNEICSNICMTFVVFFALTGILWWTYVLLTGLYFVLK